MKFDESPGIFPGLFVCRSFIIMVHLYLEKEHFNVS